MQKKVSAYLRNCLMYHNKITAILKGKKATISCNAPKRDNTNYSFASTIHFFTSVVYSESGLKPTKCSKITDTMNGTILVDAANQKTSSWKHTTSPCRLVVQLSYQRRAKAQVSVYNEIATVICHTVPHTVVATVQGNTVSVSCLSVIV